MKSSDGAFEATEERVGREDADGTGVPGDAEAAVGEAARLAGEPETVGRETDGAGAPLEGGGRGVGQTVGGPTPRRRPTPSDAGAGCPPWTPAP